MIPNRPILGLLVLALCGCGAASGEVSSRTIVFVPGAGGDGPWYGGLKRALRQSCDARVETVAWGYPLPLFAMNFSNRGVHNGAERKLARRLVQFLAEHPDEPIAIVAHSAGCGVVLGALERLPTEANPHIDNVILLAPSVSPGYDLTRALSPVRGSVQVFHSDRDRLFLSWRTSNFGTYDNVKTKAAGNVGFDLARLVPELRAKIVQHAYQHEWKDLGNDGGHDGALSRRFIATVVAPMLATRKAQAPPPARPAR